MALFQPCRLPGPPRPGPGVFFLSQKLKQKTPCGPRSPVFLKRCSAALRLTALGLRGVSCRTKNRYIYPFNRAGGRSQNRNPPQIRCQRIWFSGNWVSSLQASDWTNNGGLGCPQRFFRPLLGVQKWARRRQPRGSGAEPPLISTPGFGAGEAPIASTECGGVASKKCKNYLTFCSRPCILGNVKRI